MTMIDSTPTFNIKRRAAITAIAALAGAFLSREAIVRHGVEVIQALQPRPVHIRPIYIHLPNGDLVIGPHAPTAVVADLEAGPVEVAANSTDYWYIGSPTITRETYQSVFCQQNGS